MRVFIFILFCFMGLALAAEQGTEANGPPPDPVTPPVGETGYATELFRSNPEDYFFRVNELSGSARKSFARTAVSDNNVTIVVWSDQRSGFSKVYWQLIAADGTPVGNNERMAESQRPNIFGDYPSVVANGDRFLVVWTDGRSGYRTYGQFIGDDGALIGEDFIITDGRGYCYYPSASTNGREYLVSWSDSRDGNNWDIYAQLLDAEGAMVGGNFRVHDTTQTARKTYVRSALDSTGNMAFVWYEYYNGNYVASYSQRAADGTLLRDTEMLVDDSTVTRSFYPDVAVADTGFIAVWYQYLNGYRITGQFFDRAGNRVDSSRVMSAQGEGSEYDPSVTSLPGGEFLVSWRSSIGGVTNVLGRIFRGMEALTDDFSISEDDEGSAKSWVFTKANALGAYSASWIKTPYGDYREYETWAIAYDAAGDKLWPQQKVSDDVNSASQYNGKVALSADGSFMVAWYDQRNSDYKIYFQHFSADGLPTDSNRVVYGAAAQYNGDVAAGPDESYLIIWRQYYSSSWNIMGALYDAGGDTLKGPFVISTNEHTGLTTYNAVSSDGQRHFLATWSQYVNGYYRIFAQLIGADGSLIGENIQVSQDTTVNHYFSSSAVDTSGAFAVAWNYYDAKRFVQLRRYNSQLQPLDSIIQVSDTDNSQYQPVIAANQKGDAAILFREYRNNRYDLYYQRYRHIFSDSQMVVDGPNRKIWDGNLSGSISPAIGMDEDGNIAFAWSGYENGLQEVYATVMLAGDTVSQEPFTVMYAPESNEDVPDIAIGNGNLYTVWHSNYEKVHGFNIYGSITSVADVVSAIGDEKNNPAAFELFANYPNPFNPVTRITYRLASARKVRLSIYDVSGRLVRTLVDDRQGAGRHTVDFNANGLASGLYFYKLETGAGVSVTRKMILLR